MNNDKLNLAIGDKIYRHCYRNVEGKEYGYSATQYYGITEETILAIDDDCIIVKAQGCMPMTINLVERGQLHSDVLNKLSSKILVNDRMYGNSVEYFLYTEKTLTFEELEDLIEQDFSKKVASLEKLHNSFKRVKEI